MKSRIQILTTLLLFSLFSASQSSFIMVLGVAQDGGYPHLGCENDCCKLAWKKDSLKKYVTSLALVDSITHQWWLFEATPDIKYQLQFFKEQTKGKFNYLPSGIFITHAHIGHYTGLMQLGREVFNTKELPVYVLPKMKLYLEKNGPWSQLVSLKNISLVELDTLKALAFCETISIETFKVPHRDEFSETAGFKIITSNKNYLFIPDIDKWQKWNRPIIDEVKKVDFAFLDGTFSSSDELKNRKIEEVPHPLISETIGLFEKLYSAEKNKIFFIHFNHSNPVLYNSSVKIELKKQDFNVAQQGDKY